MSEKWGTVADWVSIALALAAFFAGRMEGMPNWYAYLMGILLLVGLVAIFRIVSRILRSRSPGKERGSEAHAQGGGASVNPPHTLAPPVADFTGRDAEIAELMAALRPDGRCDSALISGLRGMGGIGKTELARRVGHLLAGDYPDAQLEIACQTADAPKSPEQILAEVLQPFADPGEKLPDALAELQAAYRARLHGKRGFLLLDNAANAGQVRPLLPPPAGWAVVVTSRQRFALPGACLDKSLDVLAQGDARDLIHRILRAGGREATDPQMARLAALCGRLPLALRIAAAFLVVNRGWGVDEYLETLEQERLKHLDVEGEGSVLASLAISVRQLEEENRTLARRWRLLGVFPAPFDRAAAAAVWAVSDDEARGALSELHRRSLVEYDEAKGQYALHDLLREYALKQGLGPVPSQEWAAARRRHAGHYLEVGSAADDLYKSDAVEGLRRFDAALPHLRAAWAWLRTQRDAAAARWLSDFPARVAYVLDLRMTPKEKIPVLEAALAAARRLKDRRSEGIHLGNLGLAYVALGDAKGAIGYCKQALAIAREIGDRRGEGSILGDLGLAYAALGGAKRAIGYYEQALAIAREIGDRRGEGNALGNLGLAYADLGDAKRAIGY